MLSTTECPQVIIHYYYNMRRTYTTSCRRSLMLWLHLMSVPDPSDFHFSQCAVLVVMYYTYLSVRFQKAFVKCHHDYFWKSGLLVATHVAQTFITTSSQQYKVHQSLLPTSQHRFIFPMSCLISWHLTWHDAAKPICLKTTKKVKLMCVACIIFRNQLEIVAGEMLLFKYVFIWLVINDK